MSITPHEKPIESVRHAEPSCKPADEKKDSSLKLSSAKTHAVGITSKQVSLERISDVAVTSLSSDHDVPTSMPSNRSELISRMTTFLDNYVQNEVIPKIIAEEVVRRNIQPDQKIQDALRVQKYFNTPEKDSALGTPIEQIVVLFEELSPHVSLDAINALMIEVIKKGYDQHLNNPEQFVSHGFDHSLNVMHYASQAIEKNSFLEESMRANYNVSEREARFILQLASLLHDIGYPCLGDRQKSSHGISGANLFNQFSPLIEKVLSDKIPFQKKKLLMHDFSDSILFHSADKVEHEFTTKIYTSTGTFLADHGNVAKVVHSLVNPPKNAIAHPDNIIKIEASREVEKELSQSLHDTQKETHQYPTIPKVEILEGSTRFKGRFADLILKKDNLIGLEFSITDLNETPFNLIRLVDNMDMRMSRLSPIQREPAFLEIIHALGDNKIISQFSQALEDLENQENKGVDVAQKTEDIVNHYLKRLDAEERDNEVVSAILSNVGNSWSHSPRNARVLLNKALIQGILSQSHFAYLTAETRDKITEIGRIQNSKFLRHFGGCEAIINITLEQIESKDMLPIPKIDISTNQALFEQLNQIRVVEKNADGLEVEVGVGEYQIWRAIEAFSSIRVRNQPIVIFIDGKRARF